MRIVGGRLRGRDLVSPKSQPSSDAIRPTADRLRESLFNILVHRYGDPITGARVLDLFAGTGALGIEALSRGAAFALERLSILRSEPCAASQMYATWLPSGENAASSGPSSLEALVKRRSVPVARSCNTRS